MPLLAELGRVKSENILLSVMTQTTCCSVRMSSQVFSLPALPALPLSQ